MPDYSSMDRVDEDASKQPAAGVLGGPLLFFLPIIFILLIYYLFVTYWTGLPFVPELRGNSYDSLGQHLLRGEADVDAETINWEGFDINGKKFIYFGPFPALIRIPLNLAFPGHYGSWSRLSCLAAAAICVLSFLLCLKCLYEGRGLAWWKRLMLLLALSLGTPLFYTLSTPRIYHEAVLWGAAGSFMCLYGLLRYWLLPHRTPLFSILLISLSASVALLSRVTYGVPLYIVLPLIAAHYSFRGGSAGSPGRRGERFAGLIAATLPAILSAIFQAWYNYARFGSITRFIDFDASYLNLAAFGGGLNLQRLPAALSNYFGMDLTRFISTRPPYVRVATVRYADPSIFFGWKEQTLPFTLGSPWLLVPAIIGFALMAIRRKWMLLAVAAAFALQCLTLMAFYFQTQRYAVDFMPFLLVGFFYVLAEPPKFRLPATAVNLVLTILAAVSIFATVSSTISWHMFYAAGGTDIPVSYQKVLRALFFSEVKLPDWHGRKMAVSAMAPVFSSASFAPPVNNAQWDRAPISLQGKEYPSGIGMHAVTRVDYDVPSEAAYFQALVGIPDSAVNCQLASLVFSIFDQDEKLLWKSPLMLVETREAGTPEGATTVPVPVRLPVSGLSRISLRVGDNGNGFDCDHANWADAGFLLP